MLMFHFLKMLGQCYKMRILKIVIMKVPTLLKHQTLFDVKFLTCFVVLKDKTYQKTSVPKTLISLLSMIMNGFQLTLQNQHENVYEKQACLFIAQLVVFNTYKRRRGNRALQNIARKGSPHFQCMLDFQSNLVNDLYSLDFLSRTKGFWK